MSISIKKINDIKIKPIKINNKPKKEIRGYDYIPYLYPNIFLCARKKSGKTTIIYKLIKKLCHHNTKVFFFVSTIHRDYSYLKLLDILDNRGIYYDAHSSIIDSDGTNQLELILNAIEEPETEPGITIEPTNYNENIFVFDDISSELNLITPVVKKNRHYHACVIASSQSFNDLTRSARENIDIVMLFKGMKNQTLSYLFRSLDISWCEFEEFKNLYKAITSEIDGPTYNFLYIDTVNSKFRENFNNEAKIN